MSSEISRWFEDAVRKCKEGDERVCEIVKIFATRYSESCDRLMIQFINLLTGSGVATIVTLIRIVSFYVGILALILLISLAGWCLAKYQERRF